MSLDLEDRSRRRRGPGVGGDLTAAAWARLAYHHRGRPALLSDFCDNLRVQAFYRKHGFQLDGFETADVDTGLEMLRMSRD